METDGAEVETDPTLFVKDKHGHRHMLGKTMQRTKLWDADDQQLTKSCHVCQNQHIKFKCQANELCTKSFCDKCREKYHADLTLTDVIERCPVCRGVCSCRQCLRKMYQPKLVLPQNPEENLEYAERILRCGGPFLKELLNFCDQEANEFGMRLEDVEVHRFLGDFTTCDSCSTSLPDLHMSCRDCSKVEEGGTEVCMECVDECRERGPYWIDQLLTCKECRGRLKLNRMLSADMLKNMRRIAERYGDVEDRPVLPVFSYPFTEPENIRVEVDFKYTGRPEAAVRVQLIPRKPPGMDEYLEEMVRRAQRVLQECEARTAHLEPLIDWRDAGNGRRVRCVDAQQCVGTDLHHLLRLCIWKGEPLIVKNVRGVMDWRPETMTRVFVDRRKSDRRQGKTKKRSFSRVEDSSESDEALNAQAVAESDVVCVVQCGREWVESYWKQSRFFSIYESGVDSMMYKIKDWPPDVTFAEKLPRHYQDFIEMLPCPEYTNPISGMLNLTRALPEYRLRPDIGPKTYIATGRREVCDDSTDSVTKLHLDMTDAINILLHAQRSKPEDARAPAAVWTVVSRMDVATVTEYLRDPNAICEKNSYLKRADIDALVHQHGAEVWTFEQFENDAVYVPSGCPHQVRNTRSCLKVAVDFFPAEATAVVMELVQYRRRFAKCINSSAQHDVDDGLQSMATVIYACHEAFKILQRRVHQFAVVESKAPRKWRSIEVGQISSDDSEGAMDID